MPGVFHGVLDAVSAGMRRCCEQQGAAPEMSNGRTVVPWATYFVTKGDFAVQDHGSDARRHLHESESFARHAPRMMLTITMRMNEHRLLYRCCSGVFRIV
jgi:hypothetical protein